MNEAVRYRHGYGKLSLQDGQWVVDGVPPNVAIKLKAVFPKIPKTKTTTFTFRNTKEHCADLEWFLERYPMEMDAAARAALEAGRAGFDADRNAIEAIFLPDWQPNLITGFKPGFAPNLIQCQAVEVTHRLGRLLVVDDAGLGKEQPLTARILTPDGWATMGDMTPGRTIIGADGLPHEVVSVHPQGRKPVYRVTFSDGAATECGADHLWLIRDHNRRRRGEGWTVWPLSKILKFGVLNKSGAPKWEIPLTAPIEFADRAQELPVPPYLMGALLGDGSLSTENLAISIPPHENETLDRIRQLVGSERITGPFGGSCPQWHILGERRGFNSFRRAIAAMEVDVKSKEKFIPWGYLSASKEDRLELLRGLMDTDGSAKNNRITFHTCAPRLAQDIAQLVRSLGGTARLRRYDRSHEEKSMEWQVNVRIAVCPFHLSAKAAHWNCVSLQARPRRYIRSVELIGEAPQQCIRVNSPDRTYLTDDFIVTHNTWTGMATIMPTRYQPAAIVVQAHLATQWVKKFITPYTNLRAHIIGSTKPYFLPPADAYIFKYSNITGWVDIAATGKFKSVIFDEIQELRRGDDSEKGKAAKVFAHNAEIVQGLSATPIYNYGDEMFNIIEVIAPGALGTWEEFLREWCKPIGGRWMVKDPDALGAYLREMQLMVRREREGRPINKLVFEVDYDEEKAADVAALARSLAQKVISGSFQESGQAARELDMLARMTTGVAKARSVAAYCRVLLKSGIPIILAGWHRDVYEIWLRELAEFNPAMYTGSESPQQKDKAERAFVSGETDLFIMSLRSGTGLDGLQKRACNVVHGEFDWSPKVHDQITWRLDRPGQVETEVTAHFPYANGGSDPVLMSMLGLKADQSRGILNPLEGMKPVYADISRMKMLAERYLSGAA